MDIGDTQNFSLLAINKKWCRMLVTLILNGYAPQWGKKLK